MSEEFEDVRIERADHVGRIYLDRPEAMNAVTTSMLSELADAVDELDDDDEVRVIVLTGAGDDAFVGGGDIKDFQGRPGTWFKSQFRREMGRVETAIEGASNLVLAAVNGVALGGGTEIAMMCDMIVAAESAEFGLPEITLGIIPGSGGTQRLTHLVGYLKAKELILTGRHVPAAEAVEIGLANESVADDEFETRVDELAAELAGGSQSAQWFAKEAINRARADLDLGLDLEETLAALAFETADKEEGFEAFAERRDPEFSHENY